MATAAFTVTVSAGTLRPAEHAGSVMPHAWTDGGVAVDAEFTGGHLLLLAPAGCVLNDVYREARRLGIAVDGVRVEARGELDTATWASTGIEYAVDVASDAPPARVAELLAVVDDVAEIPKALRAGTTVRRRTLPC